MVESGCQAPATNTISQENANTTTVRSAVARLESTSRTPILASTAVSPANAAEPNANNTHTGHAPFANPL